MFKPEPTSRRQLEMSITFLLVAPLICSSQQLILPLRTYTPTPRHLITFRQATQYIHILKASAVVLLQPSQIRDNHRWPAVNTSAYTNFHPCNNH